MKINLNFIEACSLLEKNETTSVALTKIYLKNIKEAKELNCFNTISADQALDDAEKSDIRRKQGKLKSRFDGIPIGVKDLFCTKNIKTTASSKILSNFIPSYESTVTPVSYTHLTLPTICSV